jgi:hypothetical protein
LAKSSAASRSYFPARGERTITASLVLSLAMTISLAAGAPAVAEKHGVAQKTGPMKRQKGASALRILKRRAAISDPHSVDLGQHKPT